MGGLALKNTVTRRYDRAEFEVLSGELLGIFNRYFKDVAMPLYYRNKPSFGDVDVVVSTTSVFGFPYSSEMIRKMIETEFNPNEIFRNDNCWSFDYKECQIDLIAVEPENFEAMKMYLSYNDLGNMIGVIARGFGLKYGQEGLVMDYTFKGRNVGRIIVSQDYPKIYEFLGLDYSKWEMGFDELEDIFKFVASSKYFNWKRYQFDKLNKINRDRNKKRKSYLSLLKWIDENVADDSHCFEFEEDKSVYFDLINNTFPEANLVYHIRELEYLECRRLLIKSKFSGGELMRRFGLEGKELGDAYASFKEYLETSGTDFDELILMTPSETIYSMFKKFHFEESK